MKISHFPAVTVAQMREVDRLMVEDYGISLLQMMENAGRSLAWLAEEMGAGGGGGVLVMAGKGGNGGGALVAARHLANAGVAVAVVLPDRGTDYTGAAGHQLAILRRMGLSLHEKTPPEVQPGFIIDGLFGYSLDGCPRGPGADLIEWANRRSIPRLALDIPSGLDPDRGEAWPVCLRATATLTLALPKIGLLAASAREWVGDLFLADISVPPALYETPSLGLRTPPPIGFEPLELRF